MPYDEKTAARIRAILVPLRAVDERKMFGGLAFMVDGNMCCGVLNRELILRLGEVGAAQALKLPHTRPMDFTGKPMKTMVFVAPDGFKTDDEFRDWIDRAVKFVKTLPKK